VSGEFGGAKGELEGGLRRSILFSQFLINNSKLGVLSLFVRIFHVFFASLCSIGFSVV